jgi:hypothetical protein
MLLRQIVRRGPVLAAVLAISAGAALSAGAARSDAVVIGILKTYPVTIDVDLDITQRVSWRGIRPGCYAPAENFDMTYRFEVQSRPRKASQIKAGTATLTAAAVGATPSYGDRAGFRQYSRGSPWELQTANPANCPTASPVPSWASSPTCRRVTERVSASLQTEPNGRDGRLTITRTPKAKAVPLGASIGPSCFRALRDVDPVGLASELAIFERATMIAVPVRSLRAKLEALAEGSDRARPSFRIPVTISGDCTAMKMSGSIGDRPGFSKSPFATPNRPLGSPEDLAKAASCSIAGRGDYQVKRVGRVIETGLRPGMLPR